MLVDVGRGGTPVTTLTATREAASSDGRCFRPRSWSGTDTVDSPGSRTPWATSAAVRRGRSPSTRPRRDIARGRAGRLDDRDRRVLSFSSSSRRPVPARRGTCSRTASGRRSGTQRLAVGRPERGKVAAPLLPPSKSLLKAESRFTQGATRLQAPLGDRGGGATWKHLTDKLTEPAGKGRAEAWTL